MAAQSTLSDRSRGRNPDASALPHRAHLNAAKRVPPTHTRLRIRLPHFIALALCLFLTSAARAQLQQNFIYTTGGAIAIRNDTNGTISPVNGSPLFPLGFPAVLDAKGRFLFAAGNDSIHMYTVDSTTGLYGEVNGSPFASPNTNGPILLATEPTGTYLAVVNSTGLNPGESSVESFLIDPAAETLTPVAGSFLELVSSPVGAAANPAFGKFFVYLGPNPFSSNMFYQEDGDLLTYTIDPQTGLLGAETGADGGSASHGRSFGADPVGRFVVDGQGQFSGVLQVTAAAGTQSVLDTGSGVFPQEIFVGPGQHFVYATLFTPPTTAVHIYIVDTTNWTLTEAPSSPLPGFTSVSNLVADPTGQFVYSSTAANQTRVYSVDPSTGYFTEISNSPFTAVGLGLPIAFSVDLNSIQKEVGPVATLTPPSLSLGASNIGVSAMAQAITLSSTGDQGLAVNVISVTGANASEFGELDDCAAPTVLAPSHSCSISILFTPAASGPRQAQLTITDNAPGSPQSVNLTGTGNGAPPPAPAITFVPGTMNFPATNKAGSSAPSSVTVTNSGNAPLTISSVLLGGNNPGDFSAPSTNCIGASVAPGNSCTVTEIFTPAAEGARQATLTFTDNASGSPHSINLTGTGLASNSSGPVLRFAPASVNFSPVTQGLASVPISVTINNPSSSPLHISGISAGGNSPADFSNSVASCANAVVAPNTACTISITFAPLSSGPRSETISVTSDAPNSPQVLNVIANAPAAFTVTSPASALSASISAGQTASFAIQLTPGLDFDGSIALTCTGTPAHATCKAPSSITLNLGAPATLTVTVATSGTALLLPNIADRQPPDTPMLPLVLVYASILIFILIFYGTRKTNNNIPEFLTHHHAKDFRVATAIGLLLMAPALATLQGCGGGSTAAPQSTSVVTPAGTSVLVITPTASNSAGQPLQLPPIKLTLVVH
jgi:hypothetical protein